LANFFPQLLCNQLQSGVAQPRGRTELVEALLLSRPVRGLTQLTIIGWLCLLSALVGPQIAFGHEQQKNRLIIKRQDVRCINLEFSVSGPLVLHPILGPKQTFDAFINKVSGLSLEAFQKELEKALPVIQKGALIQGSGERKIPVRKWIWAAPPVWQQSIQQQRALIMAGAGTTGHPNPVEFTATACSKNPINRLMIGFDSSLYPLFVEGGQSDQFWLTVEIPTAFADF
jgi:hypothetical protein